MEQGGNRTANRNTNRSGLKVIPKKYFAAQNNRSSKLWITLYYI